MYSVPLEEIVGFHATFGRQNSIQVYAFCSSIALYNLYSRANVSGLHAIKAEVGGFSQ
jgi:hypothetical protein